MLSTPLVDSNGESSIGNVWENFNFIDVPNEHELFSFFLYNLLELDLYFNVLFIPKVVFMGWNSD